MTATNLPNDDLVQLISALIDDDLDPQDHTRLARMLAGDAALRGCYYGQLRMHAQLAWNSHPAPVVRFSDMGVISDAGEPPSLGFLSTALHGASGYFPEGMPLAYLIATVVTALGLLVCSLVYVPRPDEVARQSAFLSSPLSSRPSVVGRITGLVECTWENKRSRVSGQGSEITNLRSQIPNPKSPVALGDTFVLAAGLMEITYDTGAKVILQGPVTYQVESNGGYLAVGKLTGRLEKIVASGQWSVVSKSQIPNPKSEISDHSLSTIHYPLFTIRTPTAIVTDLGTEFGVEVTRTAPPNRASLPGQSRLHL